MGRTNWLTRHDTIDKLVEWVMQMGPLDTTCLLIGSVVLCKWVTRHDSFTNHLRKVCRVTHLVYEPC